ncbi:hypothetical protein D3C86_1871300 [compost metagenome]
MAELMAPCCWTKTLASGLPSGPMTLPVTGASAGAAMAGVAALATSARVVMMFRIDSSVVAAYWTVTFAATTRSLLTTKVMTVAEPSRVFWLAV